MSRVATTGGAPEGHDALLGPFSEHTRRRPIEIDVVDVEAAQLGDPHSRAVEQFEDRVVAQRDRISVDRSAGTVVEEFAYAVLRGDLRQGSSALGGDQPQCRVDADELFVLRPGEERPCGCGTPCESRAGVAALRRSPQPVAQHLEVDLVQRRRAGR